MRYWKQGFWILIFLVLALTAAIIFLSSASAGHATNIHSANSERVAWNDVTGWLDLYITDSVKVLPTSVQGFSSSSLGEVSFNCATSPSGNTCTTSQYGVCNGPGPHLSDGTCAITGGSGSGRLTGYAWNNQIGWISMNCDQSSHHGNNQNYNTCSSSSYEVRVDPVTGVFTGWGWNDVIGWISFNCSNHGCANSNYSTRTVWRATSTIGILESQAFDTGGNGRVLNSIIWHGTLPQNTSVGFQIAVSDNASGPWNFIGPGGSQTEYYKKECPPSSFSSRPNQPICVDTDQFQNFRYIKYKLQLVSDSNSTMSPVVEDVILNWSP